MKAAGDFSNVMKFVFGKKNPNTLKKGVVFVCLGFFCFLLKVIDSVGSWEYLE